MAGNNIIYPQGGINRNLVIPQNRNITQSTQMTGKEATSFDSLLQEKLNEFSGIKLSKHAELRLKSRNIDLTQVQKDKISQAVKKAEAKGIKDSLVMLDNIAFVVNVKSKTVITAVNNSELKENVFTNIDGAVFA